MRRWLLAGTVLGMLVLPAWEGGYAPYPYSGYGGYGGYGYGYGGGSLFNP